MIVQLTERRFILHEYITDNRPDGYDGSVVLKHLTVSLTHGRPQNGVPATSSFSSCCPSKRSAIVLLLNFDQWQDTAAVGGLDQNMRVVQYFHVLISHFIRKVSQVLFTQSAEEKCAKDRIVRRDQSVEGKPPEQPFFIANQPDLILPTAIWWTTLIYFLLHMTASPAVRR